MASDKSKVLQVLASRIKGKGEGEKVLADFWDYTCDLTVKTAFWKSKVASDTSEVCNTFHTSIVLQFTSFLWYVILIAISRFSSRQAAIQKKA